MLASTTTMARTMRREKVEEQYRGSPLRAFATVQHWRAWLERHHDQCKALWVKLAKKGSDVRSISYEEARDHAIAFGWIDGLKNALDDRFYVIRFTPRSKRSKWSKVNREVAEQLIAARQMSAPGLEQVEAARQDGRWAAAYSGAATIEMHPDLEQALKANPAAQRFFATVKGANRYSILYRVQDAKRPQTRARRIETLVAMLERGEVPHPGR